jgi:hypothetical protein
MNKPPKRDLTIFMVDLNIKVGADNTNREIIMGKHMEMENRTKTIFPNNKIPFMDK